MSIRLYLLLPLAFTLTGLHALPFVPRPHRLLGVAVPPKIRYGSEGRQILWRYELHLLPWTAVALLGSVWLPLSWAAVWMAFASLVPLIAAARIFFQLRAEVRPFALPTPSTREAVLTDADDRLFPRMFLFAIPLALLIGTALYLHLHWNQIPARFPVHWGSDGTPNGWSTRSFLGVYGPLFLGAAIALFISGIYPLAAWGSRRAARQPDPLIVLLAIAFVVATAFSLAGVLPLHVVPAWQVLTLDLAFFIFLGTMVWLSRRHRPESANAAGEITPDACWHWDQFYYNPQDPALFVEKRIGLGLTFNFGNRLSWIVSLLTILIPIGLAFLAFQLTNR